MTDIYAVCLRGPNGDMRLWFTTSEKTAREHLFFGMVVRKVPVIFDIPTPVKPEEAGLPIITPPFDDILLVGGINQKPTKMHFLYSKPPPLSPPSPDVLVGAIGNTDNPAVKNFIEFVRNTPGPLKVREEYVYP